MSRPKLSPLASLLPAKGGAQRPEPLPEVAGQADERGQSAPAEVKLVAEEQAREHESNQARSHEFMHVREQEIEHSRTQAREQQNKSARKNVRPTSVDDPAEYKDGPRSAVSFRMTERLQDRLREYAHHSRRKKQDILDQATHEFLRREGF